MRPYADTNFFSRLYLPLLESDEAAQSVRRAQAEASPPLPVTWLHRLETINAFQLHVFTGKTRGQTRVTPEQAAAAHAAFRMDLAQPTFLRPVQLGLPELEAQFASFAEPKRLVWIEAADHFFAGALDAFEEQVREAVDSYAA